MEKVSIIVPMYNVEQYVKKCFDSLLKQSYKNIEIWAISDGSPDSSYEIAKKYSKLDKRVIAIEKENGGYGSVLEYAIKRITSKYFIICDPDDWMEKDCIEVLVNRAQEGDIDIVVGDLYYVYNGERDLDVKSGCLNLYPIKPNVIYKDLTNFYFFRTSPHAKLFKTELAHNIKFPYKVSYTDNVLYQVYLNNSHSACYVNKALANYFFDRPGNTMSTFDNKYNQKTFDAVYKVMEAIYEQSALNNKANVAVFYKIYCMNFDTLKKLSNIEKYNRKQDIKKIYKLNQKLYLYKKDMKKLIKGKNLLKRVLKELFFKLILNDFTGLFTMKLIVLLFDKKH